MGEAASSAICGLRSFSDYAIPKQILNYFQRFHLKLSPFIIREPNLILALILHKQTF